MKTAGWIFIVIGVLSFFGSSIKGNSVSGPLFWTGLGAFLLYRANNKEHKDPMEPTEVNLQPKEKKHIPDIHNKFLSENPPRVLPGSSDQQMESLEDIQEQLTLQQREAAMCLISFFGGYNNNPMDYAIIMLLKQSAVFFGLPDSPSALSKIMSKYTDADSLIDIVLTIESVKAKEFLLLTCYDLIKSSGKSEAHDLLFNIANDLGYNRAKFDRLIFMYTK